MNPMMMMLQAMQSGMNPMQWMQQQTGNNPPMHQLMQIVQGKSPQELREIAANMAQQRGLNYGDLEQQFAQRFGVARMNRPQ